MTSEPTTNVLVLTHIDRDVPWEPTLTVALQGATKDTVHEVDVVVNGQSAGSLTFSGQDHIVKSFSVPNSWLVATAYLKTMSDDWFVDFDADGLPDLAIGRLPARTPDDVSLMVSKIPFTGVRDSPECATCLVGE